MYLYNDFDTSFVRARVREFRGQVGRRISGALTEEEFKPLRLKNGLYLQLHAYMLRVAIPYGTLNSRQMRRLADIAERWDKGYGHFTTRQNIQFNWPRLADVPDILDSLADVSMHAIQTSGNCIRNVTADHFAGAAADEIEDPRQTAELLRQWSTDHPEFQYLPRKFKIAVTGSPRDRAVTRAHDIGIRALRENGGGSGYEISIGGGLGRTPMLGQIVRGFLPKEDLLPYTEAILRVYNLHGRRDNKYKARIKILLHETGLPELRRQIEKEFAACRAAFPGIDPGLAAALRRAFAPPEFAPVSAEIFHDRRRRDPGFRRWAETNLSAHRAPGYAIATVSLKPVGGTPGDADSSQMRTIAAIAEIHGHDEIRISHEQNIIFPHLPLASLPEVYDSLRAAGLATANVGLLSDIIACPGMDYCALATARSIPVAQEISRRFDALRLERRIGPLKIKISGCINACGHHHVGDIGILGLDRAGVENYQITLGGDATENARIGERAGPGFSFEDLIPALERLLDAYLTLRTGPDESFGECHRRLGSDPFRAALYPDRLRQAA